MMTMTTRRPVMRIIRAMTAEVMEAAAGVAAMAAAGINQSR